MDGVDVSYSDEEYVEEDTDYIMYVNDSDDEPDGAVASPVIQRLQIAYQEGKGEVLAEAEVDDVELRVKTHGSYGHAEVSLCANNTTYIVKIVASGMSIERIDLRIREGEVDMPAHTVKRLEWLLRIYLPPLLLARSRQQLRDMLTPSDILPLVLKGGITALLDSHNEMVVETARGMYDEVGGGVLLRLVRAVKELHRELDLFCAHCGVKRGAFAKDPPCPFCRKCALPFFALPDLPQSHVMSYLTVPDKREFRDTCVCAGRLVRRSIRAVRLHANEQSQPHVLVSVLRDMTRLEQLHLSDLRSIEALHLALTFTDLKRVKVLMVDPTTRMLGPASMPKDASRKQSAIENVLIGLQGNLQRLETRGAEGSAALAPLMARGLFRNLTELKVDSMIPDLARALCDTNRQTCKPFKALIVEGGIADVRRFMSSPAGRELEVLRISGTRDASIDRYSSEGSQSLGNLRELHLGVQWGFVVVAEGLRTGVFPQLQRLSFNGAQNNTATELDMLCAACADAQSPLPSLKVLHLPDSIVGRLPDGDGHVRLDSLLQSPLCSMLEELVLPTHGVTGTLGVQALATVLAHGGCRHLKTLTCTLRGVTSALANVVNSTYKGTSIRKLWLEGALDEASLTEAEQADAWAAVVRFAGGAEVHLSRHGNSTQLRLMLSAMTHTHAPHTLVLHAPRELVAEQEFDAIDCMTEEGVNLRKLCLDGVPGRCAMLTYLQRGACPQLMEVEVIRRGYMEKEALKLLRDVTTRRGIKCTVSFNAHRLWDCRLR